MKSLLEQAKEVKMTRPHIVVNQEQIDLALAWLKDEVTLTQISVIMGHKGSGSALHWISIRLREAYRRGLITC